MQHKKITPQDSHSPSQEQAENSTGSQIPAFRCVTYVGIGTNYPSVQVGNPGDDIRGFTYSPIADGSSGYILVYGILYNIDTSAWAAGTSLYCGAGGVLTNVSNGPQVANVLKQDAQFGVIQITCLDTPGALTANVQDTDSINMDTVGLLIKSDLRLSNAPATAGHSKAISTVKTTPNEGLHVEYPLATDSVDGILTANDHKKLSVQNVVVVQKNPGTGQFLTIEDALDSITTNSASNPFLIQVGPGVYVEDTLTMKPFVWVMGAEQDQTVIEVNAPNKHVIVGADNAGISKCLLRGATDPGFAAVFYQSSTGTTFTSFFVEDVRFGNNDHLVISDGTNAATATFVDGCKFGSTYQFNHGFLATAGGRVIVRSSTTTGLSTPHPDFVFKATGTGSQIVLNGLQVRSGSTTSGACIHLADGATLRASAVNIRMFGIALWSENAGAGQIIDANSILCEANTMDIQIDHPDTDGTFTGSADHTKILVNTASSFSPVFACNRVPSDSTGFVTVGSILQGDRYDRLANLSKIAREATTLGVVTGGAITIDSGFDIDVTAGNGFLIDPTFQFVKEVNWSASNLTIPADSTRYIYIDTNGIVQQSAAPQSLITTIPLGKVVADSTGIHFIEATEMDMVHVGNKIEAFLRGLGPVFSSGGITSESGVRQLAVTAGTYNYGINPLLLVGGSPITFDAHYRNGIGGWTIVTLQTTVSNTQYDDGTGTLASIPAGQFANHTLYAIGDSGNESYFLIFSQATYPTLADAQAAPLPLVPSYISDAVVRMAGIIVQEGMANIVEIIDLRPRIGFAAPSSAGTTDHGNLLGLLDDDHPQYLLITGSRPMSGNLDMGGNNVVNVGLVDGVDVSAHAARHLPNGLDPIATAAPLIAVGGNTANGTGAANSLSRSDHQHAVATGSAISQQPDQANAAGTSNDLARADHVHNIATAAPITADADGNNNQGSAITFSRADHKHNIATAAPVAQTPDQANAAGASSNLARADHVHNIATAAPVSNLSAITTNAQGAAATFARSDHSHAISTGTPSTQTPDQANTTGTSANIARADHIHEIPTAAAVSLDTSSVNAQGGAATFARSNHTHAVSILNSQVSETADTTTTSGTDVLMGAMTITPAAGTYLAMFSTSVECSGDDEDIFVNLYVGGVLQAHTEREATDVSSFGSSAGTCFPLATQSIVTVNGSQAIEARWRRSAGTATAHERTLTIIRLSN